MPSGRRAVLATVAAGLDGASASPSTVPSGRSPTPSPLRSAARSLSSNSARCRCRASSTPTNRSVAVDFENVGDGDGTVRGTLNHYGPLHGASAFRLDLSAGGTATWETTIDYHLDDEFDTETVNFAVASTVGNVSREVTIRGGGTPSGDSTADGTATSTAVYSFD
jgi:hypothetical protein